MKRCELLRKAVKLHRHMLRQSSPRFALPRLGLALDLASLAVKDGNTISDIDERKLTLARIARFVERNG